MTADRGTGVSFFDLSGSPIRQTGVHFVGGDAWDVALGGSRLYVANDQGLVVINDVAAPPDIDPVAITITPTSSSSATVSGANLSIGGQGSLQVTISSGATSLAQTSVSPAGSFSISVAASGGQKLVVTARDGAGRTSAQPIGAVPFANVVSNNRGTADSDNNLLARRILVEGTNVIVSNGLLSGQRLPGSGNALLFKQPDASAPATITTVTPGWGEIMDGAIRAVYAWFTGDRLSVFSYQDAVPVRSLADADRCGREYSIAFIGNYAFTAEGECNNDGRILIYDITTPTAAHFVRDQPMAGVGGVQYRKLIAYGNYLIAISPDANRDVTVIDASNVNALVRVAQVDIPNFTASNGAMDGATLYAAGAEAGVAIVDLSNPASPQWLSSIDTPGLARAVAVSGVNEIVVADAGGPGITFINTTNKQAPVILGSQPLQGNPADVKVVGNQIYVATETRFYILRRP
jgi:hypothetical protein